MVVKKCQVCGAIISTGDICEKCEKETLKAGSSKRLLMSLATGTVVLVIVLGALRILGRI